MFVIYSENGIIGKMGFARLFTSNKRRNSLLYAVLGKFKIRKYYTLF